MHQNADLHSLIYTLSSFDVHYRCNSQRKPCYNIMAGKLGLRLTRLDPNQKNRITPCPTSTRDKETALNRRYDPQKNRVCDFALLPRTNQNKLKKFAFAWQKNYTLQLF